MIKHQIKSLSINCFSHLSHQYNLVHFVSTRLGGFSLPPYTSLNLAFHVGDNPATVLKKRELLAASLDIPLSNFVTAQQVHQANVTVIPGSMRGCGARDYHSAIPATDAMVTNTPNICLMILTADCVPILLFDPIKKVIGVAHAGWKGTINFIAQQVVKAMQEQFGSAPSDILAGIGPSIGPCCYEVGSDVIMEFKSVMPAALNLILKKNRNDKGHLNLWSANKIQLIQSGVLEKNIEIAELCTRCHAEIFYSARKDGIQTGRFGTGIMLEAVVK
ncbi:MAG: peptidoglycan editing factor PgeF [bacterium]